MKKKKILLVSSAFYPEISPRSYRATELAVEFSKQGHHVKVISKYRDYHYTEFLKETNIIFKMWGKSKFPKVPDLKKKPWSILSRMISRILLTLLEYPAIEEMFHVKKLLKHEYGYDLMISIAVPFPIHWGVAWARSKTHRIADTWVADCGDPYMGNTLDSFKKPFYFAYLEKWFCKNADYISIPVKSAITAYYPEFHHKIRIIPQGFNFDLKSINESHPPNDIPEFAYAGGFLKGIRDPGLLMKFLIKTDLPFRFYVFTNQPDILEGYTKDLEGKLFISIYIKRQELLKRLSKMDFLINFDNHTTINVPSKLIDYAIINRPVLNIDRSFNYEDLLAFLKGDYRKRMILPDPEQYHIKNVSQKFIDL